MNKQNRRDFVKNTALAATGFFIVPRHVLGRGYVAPSDKLLIAGIGAGGKGGDDINEHSKSPNAEIMNREVIVLFKMMLPWIFTHPKIPRFEASILQVTLNTFFKHLFVFSA